MPMMETESDSSDEEGSDSDFDVAADALAAELGVPATPGFKSAFKEAVHACLEQGYDGAEPEKDDGLALIFGGKK